MTIKKFGQIVSFLMALLIFAGAVLVLSRAYKMPQVTLQARQDQAMMFDDNSMGTSGIRCTLDTNTNPQVSVFSLSRFSEQKHRLFFDYPTTFFPQKPIDGKFAYSAYFTSSDIKNDYNKLGGEDVVVSVVATTDATDAEALENEIAELEGLGIVTVENKRDTRVDGLLASQYLLNVHRGDTGCDLRTHFNKGNSAYKVSMFSPGSCEVLKLYMNEYEAVLTSFHVDK